MIKKLLSIIKNNHAHIMSSSFSSSNFIKTNNIKYSSYLTSIVFNLPKFHQICKKNHYSQLMKFDLTLLNVCTAAGGYLLAGSSLFKIDSFITLIIGTALCSSSASIINQIKEKKYDAIMRRTRDRPLPMGFINIKEAKNIAFTTGSLGVAILALNCNIYTSLLALTTIFTYTNLYTPLKRITLYNSEFGSIVGAIPPLMGWVAASGGDIGAEAFFLFITLFSWQMHHFMAIAWRFREDYKKAGYKMISLDDKKFSTIKKGLFWALLMGVLPHLAYYLNLVNPMYIVSGTCVNLFLWKSYIEFYMLKSNYAARKAMISGFSQLILLMAFLIFHYRNREKYVSFEGTDQYRESGANLCLYLNVKKTESDKNKSNSNYFV